MGEDRWLDFANLEKGKKPAEIHENRSKVAISGQVLSRNWQEITTRDAPESVGIFKILAALVTDLLPVGYEALAKAPAPPYLNFGTRYGSKTVR
jgi:hypothetical protein